MPGVDNRVNKNSDNDDGSSINEIIDEHIVSYFFSQFIFMSIYKYSQRFIFIIEIIV